MQTDGADTDPAVELAIVRVLADVIEKFGPASADGGALGAELGELDRRLHALQSRLAYLPALGLDGVLARLAIAYALLGELRRGDRGAEVHDLAEQIQALVGATLERLAAETPPEVRPLLEFYAGSAIRGGWAPTYGGWAGDDDGTAPPSGLPERPTDQRERGPELLAPELPAQAWRRWCALAEEVKRNADEQKEEELVRLTIGFLLRARDGARLPSGAAMWLVELLQNQLQGGFLLRFSRKGGRKPRRRKGTEGETRVRDGAHAIAAACEFIRYAEQRWIDCNDPVERVRTEYGLSSRQAIYRWMRRERLGKVMPYGAIATAIGKCADRTSVELRTEAAFAELRYWAEVYRAETFNFKEITLTSWS